MEQVVIASNLTEAQTHSGVCCLAVLSLLGDKVSFPGAQSYNASQTSYFAQQQREAVPLCVVSPTSAEDVSAVIRSLVTTPDDSPSCRFAFRSGGHSSVPGAGNSNGGVTIDLRALNSIELSEDKSKASIGPGARWGEVYTYLETHNLSVPGGRVAQVGVGGLTTGGGISFFSPRYGWTCDSVVNFQVVLADGSIVNANEEENPDLLVALRGGSGNFGIVTRIDFRTFEQGPFRGGATFHDLSAVDDHIRAFNTFSQPDSYDEHAAAFMSFGFAPTQGSFVVQNTVYTKAEESPAVYEAIDKIPALQSTARIDTMSSFATEMGAFAPDGHRQLWIQTTFTPSTKMFNSSFNHWSASRSAVEDVAELVWSISHHPLPPNFYRSSRSTGNSLGLSDRSGTLIVVLLTASWVNMEDDDKVNKAARKLIADIESDARAAGAYDPFIYLNYANPSQDPISSYGSESSNAFQAVKERVDPNGVFSKQSAGGFKLSV